MTRAASASTPSRFTQLGMSSCASRPPSVSIAAPWTDSRPGAHVARGALVHLHAQVENGTQCPLTMTFASVPVLRRAALDLPMLEREWLPKILARDYDARSVPIGQKRAALIGMGMTERQGGSDVRSNRTRAEPGRGRPRAARRSQMVLLGAAMRCAPRARAGSCRSFVFPAAEGATRWNAQCDPDQPPQGQARQPLQRFRRSRVRRRVRMASRRAGTRRCDDPRNGPAHTPRLRARDCGHDARCSGAGDSSRPSPHRVRALACDAAADGAKCWRILRWRVKPRPRCRCVLRKHTTPRKGIRIGRLRGFLRRRRNIGSASAARSLAAEAMEVMGGNGYVEESGMPRVYREMPVNSIWEGSGNVMCLDVGRAAQREPDAMAALASLLDEARGANRSYDAFVPVLLQEIVDACRRCVARTRSCAGNRDGGRSIVATAPRAAAGGRCVLRHAARAPRVRQEARSVPRRCKATQRRSSRALPG